jgi:ubiquinone/menaquinone biosynthesis C-methylase UbiE
MYVDEVRAMNYIDFCCPFCKEEIVGRKSCCGYNFDATQEDKITYDHEQILLNNFTSDFLLNKTLNSNGDLSYYLLPEGSVSLADRFDVQLFGQYINKLYKPGHIMDVGCGILEVPGYLMPIQGVQNKFYGLDPIATITFAGRKIIGCSEYLPLPNESIDTLIFATSIDHVCNLKKTFSEAYRVLKKNGKIIIWHWYNNNNIKNLVKKITLFCLPKSRYYPYPNGVSFIIPQGAIDPFHKEYISPKKLEKIGKIYGLKLEDCSDLSTNRDIPRNNYFMSFTK